MSGDKRLADLIAALATETPDYDGRARVLDVSDPLAAILAEIDLAVLPVEMRFETPGARLVVHAAGRRVVGIVEIGGIDASRGDLVGAELSMEDEDRLQAVAEILRQLADGATRLTVRSDPLETALDAVSGLSVPGLQRALAGERPTPSADIEETGEDTSAGLAEPTDDAEPEVVDAPEEVSETEQIVPPINFAEAIANHTQAAIIVEGNDVRELHGSGMLIAMLKVALTRQLPDLLDRRRAECPGHSDPSLTWFGDAIEPGIGIAIAIEEPDIHLLALGAAEVATVFASFRSVCSS